MTSLFAPPPVVTTEVFASVPQHLRRSDRTEWADINRQGAVLDSFLEGPSFDREGNLYVTDIPFGRVFRVTPDGNMDVAIEYDGEPCGLKIHQDGKIFIADKKHGIMEFDPATGVIAPYCTRWRAERFLGCNDLVFSKNGDLYFTDQGQSGLHQPNGRVLKLSADGHLQVLLGNIPSPNGLVLSPDEKILYLAVTRANAIWRLPIMPDGGVSKVGVFIQLSGGLSGPDGLAVDEQGNLAVCHAGLGVVWLFSNLGEPLLRIQSCADVSTTNLAYGGDDRRTLFVTESRSGSILSARLDVPGLPMYSHS